jgi:prepilin-type processing-associated H-X9-DG protein
MTVPDIYRHYTGRHTGLFNVLYGDGHVASISLADVQTSLFYID